MSVTVPRTWTFIDFIVLADGRRYLRIWDASQYPSLYTYVDGRLVAREDMDYEPKELLNLAMVAFHVRAIAGATPYNFFPLSVYQSFLRSEQTPILDDINEYLADLVDRLDLGWAVADLLPTIPRETFGFHADGTPIRNPTRPFPRAQGMFFPISGRLPPG